MGNKIINLFTDGTVKTKDREFTKVVGGFGEDKPSITTKQIAILMDYDVKVINQTINRNINSFTQDEGYLIDLKEVTESDHNLEVLKTLGYTNMAISKAKNIYILSEAGFLLYLKFAEGDKAVELYKDFIEDYFKTKAENKVLKSALNDELKFLREQKGITWGKLILEHDEIKKSELAMQIEKISEQESKLKSAIENDALIKLLEEQSRLTESKKTYLNQNELGERFNNKIGSRTIGKLLKCVGLAKKSCKNTTPYAQYVPKYAMNEFRKTNNSNYDIHYKWAYEPCIKFIEKWLKEEGKYEEFYSITNKRKLIKYINNLYYHYVYLDEKNKKIAS